jgi:DNA helicase-2/ATP-dependent DNA helicase PcrA
MDFLEGLNSQQQQAVMAGTGPVLVLAGPGSGKTRVLTHRIAYLIGRMGVQAYNILAVTFTNKAAREMEARVNGLLGEATRGLTLGTFHATCARILRRETEALPFKSNFVIFDADDQLKVVKQALADLSLDEKRYRPTAIHASISAAKNELILPESFPVANYRDEVTKRVYQRYQSLLLASNALDFDDLLLWTAALLEQNEKVRQRYARRFEHVLVDEFQDTNLAQYRLLKHLASFHRNIFVVGDTDQSIYAWRGADYRNLLRFEEDFPDTQIVLLEQNYRSTQLILDAATAVIERNPHRKRKRLFTNRGAGNRVVMHEAYDDRQEAAFVIDTITSLTAGGRAKPGDFAIMYRTNAQSRVLEETFLRANLPYKLVGAQRFYGRREVKDVIAYLRLVHNPDDEISLTRVINVPPRAIGDKSVVALRTEALKLKLSMGGLLLDLGRGAASGYKDLFSGRALAALSTFGNHLRNWRALSAETPPLALMDAILTDVDYHSYIDNGTDEGKERWENVMELRRLASEYQERGLTDFLEEIALVSDQDTVEAGANVPTLLTLHAAKGLEYPIVFIVGLNDGTLPHMRSFDDPDAMHEERRLLYVGITRARDRLYLVNSQNRTAYGYSEPCEPSRFLADIPPDLLEDVNLRSRAPARAQPAPRPRTESTWQGANHAPVEKVKSKAQFAPGSRVIHPVWGEGMVLNSRLQDDDEIVDIFFEGVGMKRVAASLARLQPKH